MNEDNNERLATIYEEKVKQIIFIYPYMWSHAPYGNWHMAKEIHYDN